METPLERARRLAALLTTEREALEARDAERIAHLAAEKSRLADALAADIRRPGSGAARTGELADLIAECSRLNRINGAIAELSRQRTERCIALLRGEQPGNALYGRSGRTLRPRPRGGLAIA